MKITVEIDYPETCGKCPFYSEQPYSCHNERGYESCCSMGYMKGKDMRDKLYSKSKYEGCKLNESLSN